MSFLRFFPLLYGLSLLAIGPMAAGQPTDLVPVDLGRGVLVPLDSLPTKSADKAIVEIKGSGGLTFAVQYADEGTGRGFFDPQRGESRREVLQAVLAYIGGILDAPGRRCDILVEATPSMPAGFLARSVTFYPRQNGFFPGSVFERVVQGTDRAPNDPEAYLLIDFDHYDWNDSLGAVGANQVDLYTVILGEFTHALGFGTLSSEAGTSLFATLQPPSTTFTTFDDLVFQRSPEVKMWNAAGGVQALAALTGGNNSIIFRGESSAAAFGQFPPLYSPNPWDQEQASIRHWQEDPPIPITAVMAPFFYLGEARRSYLPFEVAALRDLGYSIVGDRPTQPGNAWILE
jgi:hypothetical protein